MDLEHPMVSKIRKTGYPDSAGKPERKTYYTPDYSRVEEETQMEFEDYTIRELLDMDARIDIKFYSGSKEKALSIVNKLGIEDTANKLIENAKVNWVEGKYANTKIRSFYDEVFK